MLKIRFLLFFFLGFSLFADATLDSLRQEAKRSSDPEMISRLAKALSQAKLYNEAIHYWYRVLKIQPENTAILWYLAQIYFHNGEGDEAWITCKKLADSDYREQCKAMMDKIKAERPEAMELLKARKDFSEKNYEAVKETLESVLGNDSKNLSARILLGKYFHATKNYAFAWDNYRWAELTSLRKERTAEMMENLQEKGKQAYDYIMKNKENIEDKEKFYSAFFLALKLYEEQTEIRASGFKFRAIEHFNEKIEKSEDLFASWYKKSWIQMVAEEDELAKSGFESALNESPDDLSYMTVEGVKELILEKRMKSREKMINLIEVAGGEDVFNMLQDAARKADANRGGTDSSVKSSDRLASINKEEFIAEFENLKRKKEVLKDPAERKRLEDEFKTKYKHLWEDPATRQQLEKYMQSDEGKKLKEKYSKDAESLK